MGAFLWFRSWHDAPTDNKYLVIAAQSGVKAGVVSAIVWALLDYASKQEDRGSIDGFDTETYATFAGFPEEDVTKVIQAMTEKGRMISKGRLVNWEKCQPKREYDSKDRVTKCRELKRSVTQCNADETQSNASDGFSLPLNSLSDSDSSDLSIKEDDEFSVFQRTIEKKGIPVQTEADIKAITAMINSKANIEDLIAGIEWKSQNNNGRPIRYVSQLVGPTQTAMAKRLQQGNGDNHKKEPYLGADGVTVMEF